MRSDHDLSAEDHWTERGRAASVPNSDATGRPRRSVLPLAKTMKPRIITASLVLLPPIIGSIAYFAPLKDGAGYFFGSYLYIAGASIAWWPLSCFLKKRTFIAGLLGLHAVMAWFLLSMSMHWGDDLGWVLYLPAVFVGLIVGLSVSLLAEKANNWMHRTPP
jgi:hypothetical protein